MIYSLSFNLFKICDLLLSFFVSRDSWGFIVLENLCFCLFELISSSNSQINPISNLPSILMRFSSFSSSNILTLFKSFSFLALDSSYLSSKSQISLFPFFTFITNFCRIIKSVIFNDFVQNINGVSLNHLIKTI